MTRNLNIYVFILQQKYIHIYLFWPKLKEVDNFFIFSLFLVRSENLPDQYLKFISSKYVDKYYHFWIIKILVPDLRGPTV